jgi:hypothetical protein
MNKEIKSETFYPYISYGPDGKAIWLHISRGIYQEVNLPALARIVEESTKIYVDITRPGKLK